MKKLRVLHVIDSMNRGGAETMLMNIYRELNRELVQFDFFESTTEVCAYDEEIGNLGGHVFKSVPKSKKLFAFAINLYRSLKKEKYDVLHVHGSHAVAIAVPLIIGFLAGIKFRVAHSHNSCYAINRTIHGLSSFFVNLFSTHRLSCSENASKWMYGRNDKVFIVNNPIQCKGFRFDPDIRSKVRQELNIGNEKVVVHVGRFNHQKNHDFLIRVFYELHKLDSNTLLLLMGKGELEEECKVLVKNLCLVNHVRFMGIREDVPDILMASDIFLFPSLFEGLPLTLLEAQASGLPCYLSDGITDRVMVTPLAHKLSLDLDPVEWAKMLLNQTLVLDRHLYAQEINKDFGASHCASLLESFYQTGDINMIVKGIFHEPDDDRQK